MQIHDFLRIYESKSDEELLLVARDIDDLTIEARAALESELSRRGLDRGAASTFLEGNPSPELPPIVCAVSGQVVSARDFLLEVTKLYRDHFWLFIKLIAPAVFVGYLLARIVQHEFVQMLLGEISKGTIDQRTAFLEASVAAQTTYFLSWIVFCICFAGISSAVARISEGLTPKFSECFSEVQGRKWSLFKISGVLYFALMVGVAISNLIYIGFISLPWFRLRTLASTATYVAYVAVILLLARFSLTIPAITLDNFRVYRSIFLSDELTERKWTILVALLAKSVLGGYVAGMLPFWLSGWTGMYTHLNDWVLRSASIAAVMVVEPFMFIGFSLLYVTTSAPMIAKQETAVAQST
jgi:hypothetical protein